MTGFIYSKYLKDAEKAKEYFKIVYEKYPTCELADDAQFLYKHAGEDVEKIIFQKTDTTKK